MRLVPRLVRPAVGAVALAGVLFVSAPEIASQQPAPQVPGAIRSRITMVPVDVRVVDRQGKPVTDLTQADFTVLEDGKPQAIAHFERQVLAPEPVASETGARLEVRTAATDEARVAERRVFLLVLGRGFLQNPSKGVDAAVKFVRERLLPQDLVAVQAYNRATPFTSDRALLLATLERFRRAHERIENRLCVKGGLASVYGAKNLLDGVQKDIDGIFGGPSGDMRTVTPSDPHTRAASAGVALDAVDAAQRLLESTSHLHEASPGQQEADLTAIVAAERAFNDFTKRHAQALLDMTSLYTAIKYLRFIQGEKHVVFVSEQGMLLPSADDDRGLAKLAADARVVLHPVQTGGIDSRLSGGRPTPCFEGQGGLPMAPSTPPPSGGRLRSVYDDAAYQSDARTAQHAALLSTSSLRQLASLTGGHASIHKYADEGFARIDGVTRTSYVVGYYPANGVWDGRFRRVEVKVNRPGVTVLHRSGYFGRDKLVPLDAKQFTAYSRIAAAASFPRPIEDIRLTADVDITRDAGGLQAHVRGTIEVSRLALAQSGSLRTGQLEVAVFCSDGGEDLVCERWETVPLSLDDEMYQRALKGGIQYALRVPLRAMPQNVKVVVYAAAPDLVGSVMTTIRK